jgi:hypothetical protein
MPNQQAHHSSLCFCLPISSASLPPTRVSSFDNSGPLWTIWDNPLSSKTLRLITSDPVAMQGGAHTGPGAQDWDPFEECVTLLISQSEVHFPFLRGGATWPRASHIPSCHPWWNSWLKWPLRG